MVNKWIPFEDASYGECWASCGGFVRRGKINYNAYCTKQFVDQDGCIYYPNYIMEIREPKPPKKEWVYSSFGEG